MTNLFPSFKALQDAVISARAEAQRAAKRSYPTTRSRGTFLCTADARGGQCNPAPEAECPLWAGTKADIEGLIARVLAQYPDVAEIYIGGGFDGANSIHDFINFDYDPWVESWAVQVWRRAV